MLWQSRMRMGLMPLVRVESLCCAHGDWVGECVGVPEWTLLVGSAVS